MKINPAFLRLQLVVGAEGLERLAAARVILFGVGGVGSWCAEALVRSGIGSLTIVDSDMVCVTNINRQVQATSSSVGKPKTAELKKRLVDINPAAEIIAVQKPFDKDTAVDFDFSAYRYVVDAIDSLSNKVDLLMRASAAGAKTYSALGAACKLDPSRIKSGSLWKSQGCPLGKLVRKRLRQHGFKGDVACVYSSEVLPAQSAEIGCGTGQCLCPKTAVGEDGTVLSAHEWCSSKKQINGSTVHITGIFGFVLAGLVINDILGHQCE